jgi:hypothetical protein
MDAHDLGVFVSLFASFCLFSFLWRDNPFYKLAEHAFIGLSIGYWVAKQWWDVLRPTLLDHLFDTTSPEHNWAWYLVPALLCLLMFARYFRPAAWLGRIPIAFVIGAFAGQSAAGYARGVMLPQLGATMVSLAETGPAGEAAALCLEGAPAGDFLARFACTWGQRLNAALIVLGVTTALLYFFFSARRERVFGVVSRIGVLFLMVAFGASFGFTVMGRVALAVGRAQHAIDAPWASLLCIALLVSGLAAWSRWGQGEEGPTPS